MTVKAKSSGFTLIEVLITVAIVAILASVALPSYRNYVIRGKIPEATAGLGSRRVQMEQFYQDNKTYVGATAGNMSTSASHNFDFTAAPPSGGADTRTATGYVLYAVGKNSMNGFVFSVDQSNSKKSTVSGVSGWAGNDTCWVTRTGGQC